MTNSTSWDWNEVPKSRRSASVTIPWSVWEALWSEFPDKMRHCGGTAQEFSADGGKTIHHVVLSISERMLPGLLTWCNAIEKRLSIPFETP